MKNIRQREPIMFARFTLAAAVAVTLGAARPAHAGLTYDAATQFSAPVNPDPTGVWSYGTTGTTLGGTFTLYTLRDQPGGLDRWYAGKGEPNVFHNGTASDIDIATLTVAAGQLGFHPGPDGEFSVVRFTNPTAGVYNLSSAFSGLDYVGIIPGEGTTTDVHVLVNGLEFFKGEVNGFGAGPTYTKTLTLAAGDTVDFVVGRGSNNDFRYDATGLSATLVAVPEPSVVVMALGGVAAAGFRRTRRTRVA